MSFKIDELIEEHWHKVLRVPPYHSHFNTIEPIWSQVTRKRYYISSIGQNGLEMEGVKRAQDESLEWVCTRVVQKVKTVWLLK
jgi:transposase